ncbi:MAG: hypothetical protein AVDCRST_MAG19-3302 [uncultured Thermomicrobiales bacterium]|uniref:Uncharacterized protein n=1 Tax=uncultured Thermomicrobiales bacterium TaxID=1645740 RepID=A0A6J4VCL8_9BACT|nr:MAG: hypothetical protein AVDCRST_MAG19-3302 [uncultured Thermomicrobiales bacterium]
MRTVPVFGVPPTSVVAHPIRVEGVIMTAIDVDQ